MNKIFGALRQLFLLGVMVLSAESYAVASGGNQQSIGKKVIAAEDVIVKPKLKSDSCGEPIYPAISKRNNEEGKVGVQLWITGTACFMPKTGNNEIFRCYGTAHPPNFMAGLGITFCG